MNKEKTVVVTVLGKDRPGIVADVTGEIARVEGNIVDIEQSVIKGLFSMFMLVDLSNASVDRNVFSEILAAKAAEYSVNITVSSYAKYDGKIEPKKKQLCIVTVMGKDKPGIVANVSNLLFKESVNIEHIKMIARGELLAMEMLIDLHQKTTLEHLRTRLRSAGEEIGMDLVVQPEESFKYRKRLVVFDMDSTIVDAEILDEIAKAVGVGKQVADITTRGMNGEIEFKESLRERVRLLKGVSVDVLEEIRKNMKLTAGTEDLIRTLKNMGFKLALVSGGFTYFTDELKDKFGFDYAYGNKLVIKEGCLTGEIDGDIIDSEKKAAILREIMKKENLSKEEVVAVGDGANDQIMLKNAGLGIAFNAKEILKKVADGSITKNNMKGLVYCLGVSDSELEDEEK